MIADKLKTSVTKQRYYICQKVSCCYNREIKRSKALRQYADTNLYGLSPCVNLHSCLSLSSVLLCYNQQLSKSQIHKQSLVLQCLDFSPREATKTGGKKLQVKISGPKNFRGSVTFFLLHPQHWFAFFCCCAANAHRLVVTLSVCSGSNAQVHLVTWADDSSAIIAVSMATFPPGKLLQNNDLCDQKASYIRPGQVLSLSCSLSFGFFFLLFLSLSRSGQ